jgi:RNA polymerase sigma-70 factor (ECF subfamily)
MTSTPAAPIENTPAYLFRVARNLKINHDRRQRILSFASDSEAALLELADEAPSPERVLISRQELALVKAVLDELPPVQRQVFILSRIEGRTFADIGRTLGVAPQTAYGHMTRILVRLKLRLDATRV